MGTVDLSAKIPNNVNLNDDKKLQRALEGWQPKFQDWFREMGPTDFLADQIYLRTAVGVGKGGWAHFEHVKMPDYRWGIFLAEGENERKIHFGDNIGQPVWDQVPGEMRNPLRRLIVTQADTEPASVEQQRLLGHVAPSLYDLRNLFQVNVEEGRHLWAMVYLLHRYFGKDGREEAEDLLVRRSGNPDNPRILQAFNKPIRDWLAFFCFTAFTDRDGKYQLAALAESGFDPLARTTQFMLTEEAHHLFVGESGVGRVIQRTCELLAQGIEPAKVGAMSFELIQRYINEWSSASYDLFGSEDSSNAAAYFAQGLKGRYREGDGIYKDPRALEQTFDEEIVEGGELRTKQIPLRRAMNALLLKNYHDDCKRIVDRWNRVVETAGVEFRFVLPSMRFNRQQGVYSTTRFDPSGTMIDDATWARMRDHWLPTAADYEYVRSCMKPVREPGKFANWIAAPARGINEQPIEFEYVKFH